MAVKSHPGGMIALYGVAIGNALSALSKGQTSIDELVALRDQAKTIVDAQGDLVAALRELDAEIGRRGGAKAAPGLRASASSPRSTGSPFPIT